MNGLVPKALEWGIEEAEFSWVLESNSFSRGALAKGGAKITKTYRLYDWALQPQRLLPLEKSPESEAERELYLHGRPSAQTPLNRRFGLRFVTAYNRYSPYG